MTDPDYRRYGRGLARIIRALEHGTTTPEDARALRMELDVYRALLAQEREQRRRRARASLGLARGTLDNLMKNKARPVAGGALVLIDGDRP